MLVAAYMEKHPGSPQTIKQHLAAIKMLFDYLLISQIVPTNPAGAAPGAACYSFPVQFQPSDELQSVDANPFALLESGIDPCHRTESRSVLRAVFRA